LSNDTSLISSKLTAFIDKKQCWIFLTSNAFFSYYQFAYTILIGIFILNEVDF